MKFELDLYSGITLVICTATLIYLVVILVRLFMAKRSDRRD
jgi:hypothetical protein